MLEVLTVWCLSNNMTVNVNKSNIVHFRNPVARQTDRIFKCGNSILKIVDSYTYLGVLLTEHLDFKLTAKFVAQSASRALGLLIAKYSWFSLSRPRLSRITAYLEVKILSLPKLEYLTTSKKILCKRGEIAPKEQFLLFSTIFSIYL